MLAARHGWPVSTAALNQVDQALRAASKQLEDKVKKEKKSQVRTAAQLFMAVNRSFAKPEAGGTSALGDAGSVERAKEKEVDADESSESRSSSDSSFDELEAEVSCRQLGPVLRFLRHLARPAPASRALPARRWRVSRDW
jgi:hypothetical protein